MGTDGPALFSDDTATDVLREFDDDQVVVVLALASTTSIHGGLSAALGKVRAPLEGPQPARRAVRRRRVHTPTLGVGQVLAHRDSRGRVHLPRVVGATGDTCGVELRVRVLDHEGTEVPDDVTGIAARTRRPPWKKVHIRVVDDTPAVRAAAGVVSVGPVPEPHSGAADTVGAVAMDWASLVSYLDSRPTGTEP
ncbi:hypothetical protein [Actinokineospora sp. HUAS TT18]|uniref:hypothetical protein n=1 Tax=Actinokineospora sp. HUAS TT18 TaxID=3447451 RepID=UPI003F51EF3B